MPLPKTGAPGQPVQAVPSSTLSLPSTHPYTNARPSLRFAPRLTCRLFVAAMMGGAGRTQVRESESGRESRKRTLLTDLPLPLSKCATPPRLLTERKQGEPTRRRSLRSPRSQPAGPKPNCCSLPLPPDSNGVTLPAHRLRRERQTGRRKWMSPFPPPQKSKGGRKSWRDVKTENVWCLRMRRTFTVPFAKRVGLCQQLGVVHAEATSVSAPARRAKC